MIFWGEHQFFETKIENTQEIQTQKLKIQVMDYNRICRNSLVGDFEIDLMSIYFSPDHCVQYTWTALSNVDKDY